MIIYRPRTGLIFVASGTSGVPAASFSRVPLPTVSRDTFNAFNTGTNIFTVPASADYLIVSNIRLQDNTPSTNIGHGFSLTDGEDAFYWRNIYNDLPANRTTLSCSWVRAMTTGNPLRMVAYSDTALTNVIFFATITKLT